MEVADLGTAETQTSTMRRERNFECPPHAFRFSPCPTTGPLQVNSERAEGWEIPRSYPLGYRSVHPEYLPRRQQPPQQALACYLPNPSEEWLRDPDLNVHQQTKKQEMFVNLMNKAVLCVEIESSSQVTVQELIDIILQDDQDLALPVSAKDVFCLWLISPILELQLTPFQKPCQIRQQWTSLLLKYTSATTKQLDKDEPDIYLKRNIFYDKQDEMRICDMKILELLYEEAKCNILKGRYPCDVQDCDVLAGIQARLELGPFNPQIHTSEFFRSKIHDYFPSYANRSRWSFVNVGSKPRPENRLLEQYRGISANTTRYKLLRKYMEFCWALPYYGSAFFHSQVEKPLNSFVTLLDHSDRKVLIGINREGLHVIDTEQNIVFLSIKFRNLAWDFAAACDAENPDCLPCIFVQFTIPGLLSQNTKLIQIFSRQAKMIDCVISKFVEDLKHRPSRSDEQVDNYLLSSSASDDVVIPLTTRQLSCETTIEERLKQLSVTTVNETGKPMNYSNPWPFGK